jgi:hypothetical protein
MFGSDMDRSKLNRDIGAFVGGVVGSMFSGCAATAAILDSARADVKSPFAMVAIDVPDGIASRSNITMATKLVFEQFLKSEYVDDLGGLELMFRRISSSRRLARISVTRDGYEDVSRFNEADWDNPGRLQGIGSWLYEATLT